MIRLREVVRELLLAALISRLSLYVSQSLLVIFLSDGLHSEMCDAFGDTFVALACPHQVSDLRVGPVRPLWVGLGMKSMYAQHGTDLHTNTRKHFRPCILGSHPKECNSSNTRVLISEHGHKWSHIYLKQISTFSNAKCVENLLAYQGSNKIFRKSRPCQRDF